MTLAEPVKITILAVTTLDRLRIQYYVVGSLASSLYGIPRATAGADIIADIRQHHIQPFVQSLKNDFYVYEERIQVSVKERSSFNIIHLETMFKIDIFLSKNDPLSKEEMARREKYRVVEEKGKDLYIASAEDIILSKLHWYKSGGSISERQWTDVMGVLRILEKRLDFDYLKNRAKKRGILDLLTKAIKQATEKQ
jgi:hypothetical protein